MQGETNQKDKNTALVLFQTLFCERIIYLFHIVTDLNT